MTVVRRFLPLGAICLSLFLSSCSLRDFVYESLELPHSKLRDALHRNRSQNEGPPIIAHRIHTKPYKHHPTAATGKNYSATKKSSTPKKTSTSYSKPKPRPKPKPPVSKPKPRPEPSPAPVEEEPAPAQVPEEAINATNFQLPEGFPFGGPAENPPVGNGAATTVPKPEGDLAPLETHISPSKPPDSAPVSNPPQPKKPAPQRPPSTDSPFLEPPVKKTSQALPYASPVPGKPGLVSLPKNLGGVPEVDVAGIAPGTAVEIPDPANPDKTIRFRVP